MYWERERRFSKSKEKFKDKKSRTYWKANVRLTWFDNSLLISMKKSNSSLRLLSYLHSKYKSFYINHEEFIFFLSSSLETLEDNLF